MVEWQVSVTLFMSSTSWLKANTFIKVYGLYSLTKPSKYIIGGKTTNLMNRLSVVISARRMHISGKI